MKTKKTNSEGAVTWRCKILSREIELEGMKASKLPGQKSKDATASYKVCRKGNTNRKGGKKAAARGPRQSSFLAKLTPPAQRKESFLRKLSVPPTPKAATRKTKAK